VHRGAYFGAYFAVELLLALDKANIFPNALDCSGNSPLHYAVLSATTKVVRVLLAKAADPYALDSKGRSPFSMAKALQLWNIVELISAPACKILIGHRPPVKKNDGKYTALLLYFLLFTFLASYTLSQKWSLWYFFICTSELLIYLIVSFKDPGYLSSPTSLSVTLT
jgi:ankyrin repeat protein